MVTGCLPRMLHGCVRATVVGLAVVLTSVLAGCGEAPALEAAQTLTRYLQAWDHGDWATMSALVANDPSDFARDNAQVFSALGVTTAPVAVAIVVAASCAVIALRSSLAPPQRIGSQSPSGPS